MRTLFIILLTCKVLFSASMFTLENVGNVNIYLDNSTDFLEKKDEKAIKALVSKELLSHGIVIGKVDPSTFFIRIESVTLKDIRVINVQVGLGEEVITKRNDNIETFAFTYDAHDMMESDKADSYSDTIESLQMLLGEFLEAYEEDKL